MNRTENQKKIMAIHRHCGETQFRMALDHLIYVGQSNFTAENIAQSKATIQKDTPDNAILTAGFQCELIDICHELSQFPTWDILLYIKLHVNIEVDDLGALDEAEQALQSWNGVGAPKAWIAAVADPVLRQNILELMVENHQPVYLSSEVNNAIRQIAGE